MLSWNIVKRLPYEANGDMFRYADGKTQNVFWVVNGPFKARLKVIGWDRTIKAQYYILRNLESGKKVFIAFRDMYIILKTKDLKKGEFEGNWIGIGWGGNYGLRMHESDPDCPPGYVFTDEE